MSDGAPAPSMDPLLVAFRDAVRRKIRADLDAEAAVSARLRAERIPQIREVVAGARAEGVCTRVWLFGSYAWGAPTEASDVDVLVEGDADEVAWRLTRSLGCEVDAWRLTDAPASLAARPMSDGIAL